MAEQGPPPGGAGAGGPPPPPMPPPPLDEDDMIDVDEDGNIAFILPPEVVDDLEELYGDGAGPGDTDDDEGGADEAGGEDEGEPVVAGEDEDDSGDDEFVDAASDDPESSGDEEDEDEGEGEEDGEHGAGGGGAEAARPADPIEDKSAGQIGCDHYRRRARIVAPCCNEDFWCRHCHNAAKYDNEQDQKKRHVVDRKMVRELVCALCNLRQPTGRTCLGCGVAFGRYCCLICNFFDDDLSKQCFHCDECGICRVGGRENFFHCKTCNCCYALSLRDQHVCIENSMHHNCPVCFEYLFDSIKPINIMPCGHTIHQECLRKLAEHSTYTCPVCMKSIMVPANMERIWEQLDHEIAATPMPEEYRSIRVNILCNDCSERCTATFHVLGHKCGGCGGYNTRRV